MSRLTVEDIYNQKDSMDQQSQKIIEEAEDDYSN